MAPHALNCLTVEKICCVREDGGEPVVGVRDLKHQIKLGHVGIGVVGAQRKVTDSFPLRAWSVLIGEPNSEQRTLTGAATRPNRIDDLLKRQLLVGVSA